jgi:predicted Zn-dependent protease
MNTRTFLLAIACIALGACATSPQGRSQLTVPTSVSAVYSEVNMQLHLVTASDIASPCAGIECKLNHAFDQRVLRLGTRLAQSAFIAYPGLNERISQFEFVIAEKDEPGTVSNAAGAVVIYRGVQKLRLDEEALAFLIAREMGHVIARHHDENSATSIMFSILAQALLPVTNLVRGAAALIETSSATAAVASVASMVGSRTVIENYRADQQQEADAIALNLLSHQGWDRRWVADALISSGRVTGEDNWSKEFRLSALQVDQFSDN